MMFSEIQPYILTDFSAEIKLSSKGSKTWPAGRSSFVSPTAHWLIPFLYSPPKQNPVCIKNVPRQDANNWEALFLKNQAGGNSQICNRAVGFFSNPPPVFGNFARMNCTNTCATLWLKIQVHPEGKLGMQVCNNSSRKSLTIRNNEITH